MTTGPTFYHEPVLLEEVLSYLDPHPGSVIVDATLGGGGHGARIAEAIAPGGTLIGIDRDGEALQAAESILKPFRMNVKIVLVPCAFGNLDVAVASTEALQSQGWDGALFDLGVSSHQLDSVRGFSFRRDEPLDMRMDASTGSTAAHLLQSASELEIERIVTDYGEDRWAGPIARKLSELKRHGGRIETTGQLAELVERAVPRKFWPKDTHVATRTFQALRIAVNDELAQLRNGLEYAVTRLKPGGRIVAISYHSLEDRIVKQTFNALAGRIPSAPGSSPAAFLESMTNRTNVLVLLTRKPVTPAPGEIARNPRSRSAKLRAAKRI